MPNKDSVLGEVKRFLTKSTIALIFHKGHTLIFLLMTVWFSSVVNFAKSTNQSVHEGKALQSSVCCIFVSSAVVVKPVSFFPVCKGALAQP